MQEESRRPDAGGKGQMPQIRERPARLWLSVALALVIVASNESSDAPRPEPEGVNSASVVLAADPVRGVVELAYEFEPAVGEFSFRYEDGRVRAGSWGPLDREFVLENGSVRRTDGEMFERVRIGLKTDADWYDRVFPALRPVGDSGLVFNTDYLTLEDIQLEEIRAHVVPGNVIAYSNFTSTADAVVDSVHSLPVDRWHYAYFGPEELVHTFTGGVIVSDAPTSSRVLGLLRAGVEPAVEWLRSFLRLERVDSVHVIAAVDEESKDTRWRGDVSESGELFLRFFGDGWNAGSEDLDRNVETFLYHELVHAVANRSFDVGDDEPEWLWEGHAEYLSLVYKGLYAATPDPLWFQAEIQRVTSECINNLEEEAGGISHPTMLRGSGPYDCGVLVYWLLDGAPYAQGAGDRLRRVWSSVAERLAAADSEYGVEDLLAAAGVTRAVHARQLVELLIRGPSGSAWQDRDRLLSELGVRVTYKYDDAWDARARSAIVDHMLDLQCLPGSKGFWSFEDHIRLDTGDRCGPLSGDPRIDRINGLSIFGGIRAVLDDVQAACRDGEFVQFGVFESSESLTVECTAPIRELRPSAILTASERD